MKFRSENFPEPGISKLSELFQFVIAIKLTSCKCFVNDNPRDSFNALPDINNPILLFCFCFKHSSDDHEYLTSLLVVFFFFKTYHGIIYAFPFNIHAHSPNPVQHDYSIAGRFHHVFYYSIFSHRHRILWFSFKIQENKYFKKISLIAHSTICNLPFVV